MRDSFEWIANEIPFVNSFLFLIPTLSFELKIRNHRCAPNSYQDNLIIFIWTRNSNNSCNRITSSLTQASCTFPCLTYTTQVTGSIFIYVCTRRVLVIIDCNIPKQCIKPEISIAQFQILCKSRKSPKTPSCSSWWIWTKR